MGTQHAHRVVVKKNTSTEDTCNNQYRGKRQGTESSVNKISGHLHKHAQQQLNGIECMQELNIHKQYACGCPSLSDSVIMFCHMRRRAYVLCVGMCVYMCAYVCVCVCVCKCCVQEW